MHPKLVFTSFALAIPLAWVSFVAPSVEARVRTAEAVRPLSEVEHARLIAELFGGDSADADRAADDATGADTDVRVASLPCTSSTGLPGSPAVPHAARPVPDPSWRRIDTFGIRETWGYTNPSQPDTSALAFVFATVHVPSAYQHCHQNYEVVTDMEVRIVPIGGGATTVLRAQLQPGGSAVSIVVPASVWRNAERGRVLAWAAWGNPMIDNEALSDQEFSP